MTRFEWHTADEDETLWTDTTQESIPRPRGRLWRLILALVLVAGLAGLILNRINAYVATVQSATMAEIDATGMLLQDAATAGDVELFTTLLSGRDPDWTATQQKLVAENLFADRPALNLRIRPDSGVAVSITVEADLQTAKQIVRLAHVVETPAGETESITLLHTNIFRRGEQRWLFAPPEATFWGPWRVAQGNRLMMSFPERDAVLARRLLADLDELAEDLCALSAPVGCRQGRFLWVRFSPDIESLLAIEQPDALVRTGRRLILPTPSLVGLPVDEPGYQALLAGYAPYIAARVVAKQVQWRCCLDGGKHPGNLVYQALLKEYLHRQKLLPPSVINVPLPGVPAQNGDLSTLWAVDPSKANQDDQEQAHALVARLVAGRPDIELLQMMQAIGDNTLAEAWYLNLSPKGLEPSPRRRWNAPINNE